MTGEELYYRTVDPDDSRIISWDSLDESIRKAYELMADKQS